MSTADTDTQFTAAVSAGDQAMASNDAKTALEHYRQALALRDDVPELFDKLIAAHRQVTEEWGQGDFTESLAWEMRKQELTNPAIRAAHLRLDPAWEQSMQLITELVQSLDEPSKRWALEQQIEQLGEPAQRALFDYLAELFTPAEENAEPSPEDTP